MLIGATDHGEKRFIASEQGYRKAGLTRYDRFQNVADDLARFTNDVSIVFKLGQKTENGWRKLCRFRRLADVPRVFAARNRTVARSTQSG